MEFKKNLTLGEAKGFIDTAVSLCYDNNDNYVAMLRDFARKYVILGYCTDYPIDEKTIEEIYADVYSEGIGNEIREYACENEQICRLIDAVDEEIEIRKQKYIRTNKLTKFIDDILEVANQASENPETAEQIKNVLTEVVSNIENKKDSE